MILILDQEQVMLIAENQFLLFLFHLILVIAWKAEYYDNFTQAQRYLTCINTMQWAAFGDLDCNLSTQETEEARWSLGLSWST